MKQQITDSRLTSARIVKKECFWSDYNLSAHEILDKLARHDSGFEKFLFSKIIEIAVILLVTCVTFSLLRYFRICSADT